MDLYVIVSGPCLPRHFAICLDIHLGSIPVAVSITNDSMDLSPGIVIYLRLNIEI